MPDNHQKVLLRITNLKQYFPLKKKGQYVKANDGITLDIYEGETFGLVGESGCGKSTLGRTLLQLYRQTDGRTIYYGRDLYEIVPKYIDETLRHIDRYQKQWHARAEKVRALQAEYNGMVEGEAKYRKANELARAQESERAALWHIANLIGGFAAVDASKAPIALFRQVYKIALDRKAQAMKYKAYQLAYDDLIFRIRQRTKAGRRTVRLTIQLGDVVMKRNGVRDEMRKADELLAKVREQLDEARQPYANDPVFQRYEVFRDNGVDLARLNYNEIRMLRSDLQLIFQDPYSSLNPRMTVGNIIGEGLLAHGFFRRNDERMQKYIVKVMEDAGLAGYFLHRFPHQFSGGQRQRIGIARSLAVQPKFVVCDEAVSALDVSIQSQIINLLYDLKQKSHLTYMFITHDLSVVKYISDRIGVMYLGNLVELADTQAIFDHPRHPYTESLIAAIPTTDIDAGKELRILEGDIPSPVNPPKGCKFHTRCSRCSEQCTQQVPKWVEISPNHFVACHHPLEE